MNNHPEIFAKFSEVRQLYEQFVKLEKMLLEASIPGWVTFTSIHRPDIMRLITRVGVKPLAQPFYLDPKEETIYFWKIFNKARG